MGDVLQSTAVPTSTDETRTPLSEIALLFLKLGTTAFGGPAAHIAMMLEEVVHRRHWLTQEEFLDRVSAANLIPGPSSTELAIHIGLRRGGWSGLVVAGACFILPAALIVGVLAWVYVRFGSLPQTSGLLYGVKPVVIAIVVQALWKMGRAAVKTKLLALIGVICLVLTAAGMNVLLVLVGGGVLALVLRWRQTGSMKTALMLPLKKAVLLGAAVPASGVAAAAGLWPVFFVFVKIGSVLFGSGYVLLAFLRADLVDRHHWLTTQQLLDAVAVGQFTPGPVFTTATFVGYILHGAAGAAVATLGIFLPAFVFVAISAVVIPRVRRSPAARAVLDGINVASLALMAWVTWQLARAAVVDWFTVLLLLASTIVLLRLPRVNSAWLILISAFAGLLKSMH